MRLFWSERRGDELLQIVRVQLKRAGLLLRLHFLGKIALDQIGDRRCLAPSTERALRIASARHLVAGPIGAPARLGKTDRRIFAEADSPPRAATLRPVAEAPAGAPGSKDAKRQPTSGGIEQLIETCGRRREIA